jgi:hypothetical protein
MQKEDPMETFATIVRREMILKQRQKLARRKARRGYLLVALLLLLAGMCGAILYVQSHPMAPTYSYEDRQALDQLVRSLR